MHRWKVLAKSSSCIEGLVAKAVLWLKRIKHLFKETPNRWQVRPKVWLRPDFTWLWERKGEEERRRNIFSSFTDGLSGEARTNLT